MCLSLCWEGVEVGAAWTTCEDDDSEGAPSEDRTREEDGEGKGNKKERWRRDGGRAGGASLLSLPSESARIRRSRRRLGWDERAHQKRQKNRSCPKFSHREVLLSVSHQPILCLNCTTMSSQPPLQLRSHPKADLRFLHHLNRLYALLSSSHHVQRDQALVAGAEDQEGLLRLGVLVNDLDLEELRDLTLAEAFRPILTTTIADQIRDSPQIWYGFRAGLNEKSIHIWEYSQSDHVVCRLIVDENTLDCLVIEAKESGHLAELTG
ncbi:hypothetical protein BLNAU_23420 [Blattamonas nauphoetae]|uniref:Uncharacterized protein n=1 Tax=Blattamonas nauphoetae TaxID=2049346 RepID=A0ABQ9WQA9_9EUKA|nr:hypothetical protein BLNAU_23420 [Blattamonas nauphoetae]